MTEKKSTNPFVLGALLLAVAFVGYMVVDTVFLSTKKSSHPELDEGIQRYKDTQNK